jgi:putative membrane protein
MMGGLGMGFGMFGLVLMILFWGGLIALAVWLVRLLFPSANRSLASPSDRNLGAREILDRRFARGEISREEYDLMRETISDGIA